MCPQQLLKVGLEPGRKPQAILFVIDVFTKGQNGTGIIFGLGIVGDGPHNGAYRHGNVHLAE